MTWSWFDLAWPWIGAVAAASILVLLFGTERLRSDASISRWRDPVWLSWLAAAAYMIHNVEEYGIDILGRKHYFPEALCLALGLGRYPACPVPASFFLAVNISLFWVAAPLAALLSGRHPLIGLVFYGLLFTNGLAHVIPMLLGRGFSPGTLTAIVLFFALFLWVARNCFGAGRIPCRGLAAIVGAGALVHAILIGSLFLFLDGRIGESLLAAIQVLNAGLFLCVPWMAGRILLKSSA